MSQKYTEQRDAEQNNKRSAYHDIMEQKFQFN
nr:MAG TPA: hypothetical protein [Caudoviricetes sp.]